jgi:hypothetical protein
LRLAALTLPQNYNLKSAAELGVNPHMPRWFDDSKRLAAAGNRHGAYRVLREAAASGDLEPLATLARMMWSHCPNAESLAVLEDVERRVTDHDWKTHFAIHIAYSVGVGAALVNHEELQRRSFTHLRAAASASGDARMHLSVGLHYWQGLNGVAKDTAAAQRWLEAAASAGQPDIVADYERFLKAQHSRGRPRAV